MRPSFITSADWSAINIINIDFTIFAVLIIGTAVSFLIAAGGIPSLVSTHHLPNWAMKARPIFYIIALLALILALLSGGYAFHLAIEVIERLFPRWWI